MECGGQVVGGAGVARAPGAQRTCLGIPSLTANETADVTANA